MDSVRALQELQRYKIVSQRRKLARSKLIFYKTCIVCGKSFTARSGSAKYCSPDCKPDYYNK